MASRGRILHFCRESALNCARKHGDVPVKMKLCSDRGFLTWGNVLPINRHRQMNVVYREECVNISDVRLQLGWQGQSYSLMDLCRICAYWHTVQSERYCQILVELNLRFWRNRPYLELPLLYHHKARPQRLRAQLQRVDALASPSLITHNKILSWGLRMFITSHDEIGVELRCCLQRPHDGLRNNLNIGGTV
jgi:hypothetical protein